MQPWRESCNRTTRSTYVWKKHWGRWPSKNEKISNEENENVGVCNAQREGSLVTPLWEPFLPFLQPSHEIQGRAFSLTTFSNIEFSSRLQFLLTFSGWFDIEGHMMSDYGEKLRISKPVGAVWLLAWFCLFLGLPARRGWSRKHLVTIIWDEELIDSNWEWLSVTSSSQKNESIRLIHLTTIRKSSSCK